jgi:hypothetical protein
MSALPVKMPDTVITVECLAGGFVVTVPTAVDPTAQFGFESATGSSRVEYVRTVHPTLARAKRAVAAAMAEWSHLPPKKGVADEA